MSKKFTNVIDRGRTVANKYNIVNNSDGTAIITDIPNNINVAGTPLDKNLFNPMQEGLNFTVGTVHTVENSTDVYELDIDGLKGTNNLNGLELFDGLTFNIKITEANTTNVVMLRISGDKYNLTKEDGETVINLTVGELQKNRYYKVIFDGVRFVIPLEMVEYNQFLGTNFGGLLGTVGTKKVGVAYYDVANKQMVVPKIENDLTYYESTKFIPISDYQTANKLENLSENWNLIFFGKLEEWTEQGVYIPFSKKFTKIKIAYTAQRNVNNAAYGYEEYTLSKNNFKLVSTEHTLAYVKEDSQFLYFQIVSNTNVNDNYAYIYAK